MNKKQKTIAKALAKLGSEIFKLESAPLLAISFQAFDTARERYEKIVYAYDDLANAIDDANSNGEEAND